MEDPFDEVRRLLAKSARVAPERIMPTTDLFMDLGIDSLEGLKLLAALEQRFGVVIPDHELMNLTTPARIVAAIAAARPAP